MVCLTVCLSYCLTVCLSYCVIVCLFYAKSAAKILLFLHICKQNPKNMQNLPISDLYCFFSALLWFHFSFLSHICGSFPPPCSFCSVFPRLVPFFLFLLLQANSICRSSLFLAWSFFLLFQDDTIVRSFPPPSLFLPKNLIILTFSSPKICIYQKKCVPLHRKVRIGVPDGRKRSASGGESGGIGCPFI